MNTSSSQQPQRTSTRPDVHVWQREGKHFCHKMLCFLATAVVENYWSEKKNGFRPLIYIVYMHNNQYSWKCGGVPTCPLPTQGSLLTLHTSMDARRKTMHTWTSNDTWNSEERIHNVHTLRSPIPAIAALLPRSRVTICATATTAIPRRCPTPPASCPTISDMRRNFCRFVYCSGRHGFVPRRVVALAWRFDWPPRLRLSRRKFLEPLNVSYTGERHEGKREAEGAVLDDSGAIRVFIVQHALSGSAGANDRLTGSVVGAVQIRSPQSATKPGRCAMSFRAKTPS